VLAAEQQSAGRGRLGRAWISPPRAALTFSVLLRPAAVPRARLGWLPLLAGVAVAAAVRAVAGVDAQLKWPNDVLAGPGNALAGGSARGVRGGGASPQGDLGGLVPPEGDASTFVPLRKLGGILAEASGEAVVVGIGVNVSTEPTELPPPGPGALAATSLRLEGAASLDRERLLAEILAGLERRYLAWCQVFGDTERSGLRAEYTGLCATLGRRVRVELPGGRLLDGLAAGIDADGRLLVSVPPDADLPVAAGDIVHLR
jgi:BirA family transcriptional regulator, biotin operon repressor / biotin---[acetyl-CoA-carboxylase] ligase